MSDPSDPNEPSGPSDAGRNDEGGGAARTDRDVEASGSGRRYLAGAAVTVVAFVAVAGYVVAANNGVDAVTVFGVVTIPGTPTGVALYGVVLSVAVLALLFGLVTVASRFDDAGRERT
ncbi:DUF7520 family protein [Candidatus Halobonum tyrrellensis]|uniref:Cox cluster protein n=1 Tax=Candidatus Halobonum tyrrellensis G22 TaxID=1324957 RepID=V4HDD3_9EURY|nr:hypothetical protein [Candidatus Halobonum tyrrellensis]ESP88725.1 hypothetical protein K933_07738 [Candidatus Halobonum tyrrellensis G22]